MRASNHIVILVIGLFASIIGYSATKTAVININANVVAACEVGSTSTGGSISFGMLDFGYVPDLSTSVAVVGQANSGGIRIKCSNNTPYIIYMNSGLNSQSTTVRYLSNGSTSVRYNLYIDSAHTVVWDDIKGLSGTSNGQETWLPIYGFIPQQSVSEVGIYTDRVGVTITY